MTGRRVVVTGLGAVSAAGVGLRPLLEALHAGTSQTRRIVGFDPSGFPCQVAGEVLDFSARGFVPKSYRKAVKVMARDIELAVAAADLAFRDAAMATPGMNGTGEGGGAATTVGGYDGSRVACNIGAGLICADLNELGAAIQTSLDEHHRLDFARWGREGMNNLTPLWLLKYLPNMLACHVTIIHALKGPSNTITCGEASALLSIAEAASQIARGDADAAIAGGAETKLNPMGLLRQGKLGRLTTNANDAPGQACRPFDSGHAGTVLGEGAGLLVLEEADCAVRRGARIYAELVGFGAAADPSGCDPHARHCGNFHLACRRALEDAGIGAGQLDLVIAHGTGVPHEDTLEAARLSEMLEPGSAEVLALTGAIGDTHAAAGALGAAVAATALFEQKVPASVNFDSPAADCQSLRVSRQSHERTLRYALVECFSHAGQSAAAVLKTFEGGPA